MSTIAVMKTPAEQALSSAMEASAESFSLPPALNSLRAAAMRPSR